MSNIYIINSTFVIVGGVTFEILSKETFDRHALTYGENQDMLVLR